MTEDSLFAAKKADNFTTESPVRAFTDFQVAGRYAIGKGFRPSLAHLSRYLDAMETKEGWQFVQVLIGDNDPTIFFRRVEMPREEEEPYVKPGVVLTHIEMDHKWTMPGTDLPIPKELRSDFLDHVAKTLAVEPATLALEFGRTRDHEEGTDILRDEYQRLVVCPILDDVRSDVLKAAIDEFRRINRPVVMMQGDKVLSVTPLGQVETPRRIGKSPLLAAPFGFEYGEREPFKPGDHGGGYPIKPAEDIYATVAREMGRDSPVLAHFEPGVAFGTHSATPVYDDANPAHYQGWECGDIGERLSANGYQILKYVWRLGKKDDPCKEIGKAIRYCERERDLIVSFAKTSKVFVQPNLHGIPHGQVEEFFVERLRDQSDLTRRIARMLWIGYDKRRLQAIHEALTEHRFHLDCGRGLAI